MVNLLLLIGIPGSGKSSLAAQLQQISACRIISTDSIRAQLFGNAAIQGPWLLIWREVNQQFREAVVQIQTGQIDFAIYDATNTRRRVRRDLIALARSVGFSRIVAVWLDPPLELCCWRNHQRGRQVPEAVIQRMYRQLWSSPPRLREGIDLLLHYGTTAPNSELLLQFVQPQAAATSKLRESTEIAPSQRQEPNPSFLL
ncbi:MAG: AAA family ATPase [Elainella sp. C42_A2020_010]|nr:AAA family ATPase [Elainella sp. C42_A2020_010]RNJ67430.1 MAG: AAA family ATPase [Leptolyngbya sp. IPPAS B-1204]